MDPSVFIDGTPAAELGKVKSLGFTRSFGGGQGGGFRDARLSLDLEPGFQHPSLRLNAPVELRHGADSLGKGNIVSIDRNTWEIVVDGIVRLGEDYESRTNAGEPAGLATGLPAAIGRGLPWIKDPSLVLPGDVVGQSMQSISDALNDFATQQNKSWLLDGDTLRMVANPTTPSLMLMATDNPNSSTDGLVSVVTAKYAGAVDEQGNPALIAYVTVAADDAPKRVERTIDLTSGIDPSRPNVAMTAAEATAAATAALTSGATSPLTESVSVSPGTLFTAAGDDLTDILCTVREGQMVRQLDWVNPDGSPGLYRDWIIGGVDWSTDGGLVLTPVGGTAATLAGTIIDLRQGVDSAQGTADTALAVGSPDPLAARVAPESAITFGPAMPTSAQAEEPASLWVNGSTLYICTTSYASGGTMSNWTVDNDPRTRAMVFANIAQAQSLADLLNGYQTTVSASAPVGLASPSSRWVQVPDWATGNLSVSSTISGAWQGNASGGWDAVSTNLDWVKQAFSQHIVGVFDYLKSNLIEGTTLRSTNGAMTVDLNNGQINFFGSLGTETSIYSSGSGIALFNGYGNYGSLILSALNADGVTVTNSSATGTVFADVVHAGFGGINSNGTVTASGDMTATGYVVANYQLGSNLTGTSVNTASPNVAWVQASSGTWYLTRTSASSRTVKYDIEPFEAEDDLAALEACGVFAFHYCDDPEARLVIGLVIENMLEAGLRRYVDFDENGVPYQPAWTQINALQIAGYQQNRRDIAALKAENASLRADIAELKAAILNTGSTS